MKKPRRTLTPREVDEFFERHLPHRLTLLRAFPYRESLISDWQGRGDIFRCLEESALLSIRLFIEALGMEGFEEAGVYTVRPRSKDPHPTDVLINDLGGKLVSSDDIQQMSERDREILGRLWCLASKELAHLTSAFVTLPEDKHDTIRCGIKIIEALLTTKLFEEVRKPFPPITTG